MKLRNLLLKISVDAAAVTWEKKRKSDTTKVVIKMLTVRIFFTRYQEKIPNCEADEALEQLPREILDALSLEVFIARLDGVQSNLVYKCGPVHSRGVRSRQSLGSLSIQTIL